jgi:capsular exopolysaccharide synthesis family protein
MEFLKLWEILVRRRFVAGSVFLAFFLTVLLVTLASRQVYKAEAKLLMKKSDSLSSLMSALGITVGASSSDDGYDTDIALAEVKPLLDELISELDIRRRGGEVMKADKLVKWNVINTTIRPEPYIDVDQYEEAEMLKISAYSTSPELSDSMANGLADLYMKDIVRRTREDFRNAKGFIEERIRKVQEEYHRSLAAMKDFSLETGSVDLALETQNAISKIATLKTAGEDNEKDIALSEKKIAEVRQRLNETEEFRKDSEEFSQSDQMKSLKTKLNEQLIGLADLGVDYTREHPKYKQAEVEIEAVRGLIQKEAALVLNSERRSVDPVYEDLQKTIVLEEINVQVNVAKRRFISRYLSDYQAELLNIPVRAAENAKLDSALSVNRGTYEKLLGYLNQVGVAESVTLSDIRLVEKAAADRDEPSFPSKPLNVVLGLFFGAVLGISSAFFVEFIDNTVKSDEDLSGIKSMTPLGTVPFSTRIKESGALPGAAALTQTVEAFRNIRNGVRFSSRGPLKSIAVTSSIASEGKTTVAANLAASFANEGRRVLLADMNLRRPSVHACFNAPNDRGMTNVLAGELKAEAAVRRTDTAGLDILTSGPTPPDPGRLIEPVRLRGVIGALEDIYDVVVIDTPPMVEFSDAATVGALAGAMVYVIEAGVVNVSTVEYAAGLASRAGINLAGSVLNKFRPHRFQYDRYRYLSGPAKGGGR